MKQDFAKSIMLVAGEASGDVHGAEVVKALKAQAPQVEIFGMGGTALRAAGMETVVDSETSASVMGVTEVVKNIGVIIAAFNQLLAEAKRRRPAVVILIDYPDFNLRLAKKLRADGIKVLYYICPQVWAWRQYRVHGIARSVDKIASIFPFEADFYRRHNVAVEFVGHPFADRPLPKFEKQMLFAQFDLNLDKLTLALLPGSRKAEIEKLFPTMIAAFQKLSEKHQLQALVPIASSLDPEWVKSFAVGCKNIAFIDGQADVALTVSDAAIVASGTATMEAALVGNPFCVVYRVAPLTYRIGRLLIRGVDFIAMPNIIAGREIVPELLQEQMSVERLVQETGELLFDQQRRQEVRKDLAAVRDALRAESVQANGQTAPARVAALALELAGK